MLKFFEKYNSCDIVLEYPMGVEDIKTLKILFKKNHISWHLKFGRVYSVSIDIINILYKEIFENKKNITITTHKYKLSHYLHQLGFISAFKSLIKDDVLKIDTIELVLIGGSADSSPKIMEIVKNITLHNLTLVVVQHVEPHKVGFFDDILQKYTNHKVKYVKDGEKIKKNMVYLAPHNKHLKVTNGYFTLGDEDKYNYAKPSVSVSYESFSSYYKEKLLVIQECGYASDGVDKLEFLKRNNSKLIIQDKNECEAKPMVINALEIGAHDYILNQENITNYINLLDKNQSYEAWVDYLLDMILKKHAYDFRLYKRSMIKRRLDIFMLKHDIKNIKDAVGIILFNKSAFKGFFLEISINVTQLFRKPKSFKEIKEFLHEYYRRAHNIKIWSAGCSSGEEVYSIAILLSSLGLLEKSIIYATDFNNVILEEAKNGIYPNELYEKAKENFAQIELDDNLDSYITKNDNFISINENIRKKTLFFQHNLVTDSSFNEFDIIICKNVIIYFDYNLQQKVFQLFYDSLKFGGYLVLGESESIHELFRDKFEIFRDDCKIFKKVA